MEKKMKTKLFLVLVLLISISSLTCTKPDQEVISSKKTHLVVVFKGLIIYPNGWLIL
jgi:hypothetical protein